MNIVVVFGLPGAGKTFVGEVLRDEFGYFLFDGDAVLPHDMKQAIDSQQPVTVAMRDRFFNNIIQKTCELVGEHPKLCVSQTFINDKYRQQFLNAFPDAMFILIETESQLREARLQKRTYYPLDIAYARQMVPQFDPPSFPYRIINNNSEGKTDIIEQVKLIFQKNPRDCHTCPSVV